MRYSLGSGYSMEFELSKKSDELEITVERSCHTFTLSYDIRRMELECNLDYYRARKLLSRRMLTTIEEECKRIIK